MPPTVLNTSHTDIGYCLLQPLKGKLEETSNSVEIEYTINPMISDVQGSISQAVKTTSRIY